MSVNFVTTADDFIEPLSEQCHQAHYIIDGMTCGGCVSKCEHTLLKIVGVSQARILFDTKECHITFDPRVTNHHTIEAKIAEIGFRLQPFERYAQIKQLDADENQLLAKIGVAGIGMMQVMMSAIALYYGDQLGMSADVSHLLGNVVFAGSWRSAVI